MVFKLFATCVYVKGVVNSTICDLHRGKVILIENKYGDIIDKFEGKNLNDTFKAFKSLDKTEVESFLSHLVDAELGFWTNEPELFPELSKRWASPEIINNAIIEIEKLTNEEIKGITHSLGSLLCRFVELRCYKNCDLEKLTLFITESLQYPIKGIVIYAPAKNQIDEIKSLVNKYRRISLFIIHSADSKKITNSSERIKILANPLSRFHCGNITKDLFTVKVPVFMESQFHNSCLNKKISIDLNGDIRNCPSMKESFGNIKDTKLEEVVENPIFKEKWDINKDKILVCKSCEFRYVCTDCRAYVEDPNDILSKPLKCGYNPFTGEWNKWSDNPLKQKAIDFYGLRKIAENVN